MFRLLRDFLIINKIVAVKSLVLAAVICTLLNIVSVHPKIPLLKIASEKMKRCLTNDLVILSRITLSEELFAFAIYVLSHYY